MLRGREIQRKPSGPPSRLHGGSLGRLSMKWDEPPLWPVVVPSLVGFSAACMPYLFDWVPRPWDWVLAVPFLCLVLLSPLLYFSPNPAGVRIDLVVGANVAMFLAIVPQLFLFVWFIVVILIWISQSMYVWRHNFPPFRIGTWIGLGAVSGLFIGSLFAHFIL